MASPPGGGQLPWQYSAQIGGHYVYVPSMDQLIISNATGVRRIPRPPTIAPELLTSAVYEGLEQPRSYEIQPSGGNMSVGNAGVPMSLPAQQAGQGSVDRLAAAMGNLVVDEHIGDHGQKVIMTCNKNTGVQNRIQVSPPQDITDPELLRPGRSSEGRLLRTPGDEEPLKPSYKIRPQPRNFFVFGRVFLVLWAEPAGGDATTLTAGTTLGIYGERVYSSVRRFVVIREGHTYCSALPITTYGGRGVGKRGVKKSEHAIIHTSRRPPAPMAEELPSRRDPSIMRPRAIRVDVDLPVDKLDAASRLNLGAVTTVQHNVKVRPYGMVNQASRQDLISQFTRVWNSQQNAAPIEAQAGPSTRQPALATGPLDPARIKEAIRLLVANGRSPEDARAIVLEMLSSKSAGKQPANVQGASPEGSEGGSDEEREKGEEQEQEEEEIEDDENADEEEEGEDSQAEDDGEGSQDSGHDDSD